MKVGFVSFIGRPNAGKSTLVNRVVGTKLAIVSDKPQTTRNRILAVRNYAGESPAQVVLVDTPGIHRPLHRMNVRMVDVAIESIGAVDVVVLVRDSTDGLGSGDRFVLKSLASVTVPVILILNKIDLIAKARLLPLIDWYRRQREFAAIVPVSASTGDGMDTAEREIIGQLPDGEPLYPEEFLTDQPERVPIEALRFGRLIRAEEQHDDIRRLLRPVRKRAAECQRQAEFQTMPCRMAVVGVPNTGKSTLLNQLRRSATRSECASAG